MHYLLVHGACHDAWCWHRVESRLVALGHSVRSIDLPFEGLDGDIAATAKAIDVCEGPLVLAGHSYGGMVITAAAHGQSKVSHLVYVAALLPEDSPQYANVLVAMNEGIAPYRERLDDGRFLFTQNSADFFYNTCTAEEAREALTHLRPMVMDAGSQGPYPEAWRDFDSTYVLCRHDNAIPLPLQQSMAKNAGHTIELDCDHSPFFSATAELVEALVSKPIVD